ncbi:Neurotransmitter-gated ion-channel ligand-binding domain [Trinorchestia longiramus]|nr:Neurotransmitter-gated ion-channel ligand-binding domain [Trinorchestia longiramus]
MGTDKLLAIVLFILGLNSCCGFKFALEDILKPHHSYIRPENHHGVTYINVSVVLNSLEMDDSRRVMRVSGELVQEWEDEDLRFAGGRNILTTAIGLYGEHGQSIKSQIWLPDMTPSMALEQDLTYKSDFLRLTSEGRITWTKIFSATVPCEMELAYYPFENYRCLLMFHSLGYDTEELRPNWSLEPAVHYEYTQVSLPCEIDDVITDHSSFVTTQRARRRLEAEIEMECYSGWTIKHTVVPFMVSVTMAYLVFYLHPRAVTSRLLLSLMSFIIAMMVHERTYRNVPQYPYTMAIEVFTGTCLGFIFSTMVETLIVDTISRSGDKLGQHNYSREVEDTSELGSREQLVAQWLDRAFRIMYPLTFIIFNIIYWIVLMTQVAQLD